MASARPVRTLRLGDAEVTRIGLGTNRLTYARRHVAFVEEAVAAGVSHIDTAHLYTRGQSEETIGAALSAVADDIVGKRSNRKVRKLPRWGDLLLPCSASLDDLQPQCVMARRQCGKNGAHVVAPDSWIEPQDHRDTPASCLLQATLEKMRNVRRDRRIDLITWWLVRQTTG